MNFEECKVVLGFEVEFKTHICLKRDASAAQLMQRLVGYANWIKEKAWKSHWAWHYLFKAWVCLFLWQLNKLYFFWSLLVCRIHYTIQKNHVWILIYSVFKKLLFYFLTPKWMKIWLFWAQIKCNFGVFIRFGDVLQCFRMSGNAFLRIPVTSAFSIYL